jgi:hypothetical protein
VTWPHLRVLLSRSFASHKQFNGKRYTGMQVGRSDKWRYDAGEWKERKVTPDRWEFQYSVVKRRAGRAPEGSGAPVGTAYHWYIVADQTVTKLDANSYQTDMVGHKLKVAHRRADRSSWSASERTQNKQLVKLLRELADDLESRAEMPAQPDATTKPAATAPRKHTARHRTASRAKSTHRVRAAHRPRARPQHRKASRARPHRARASR